MDFRTPPVVCLYPKPPPKEYDRLGHEIVERKFNGDYKNGRLVFYGYEKKLNQWKDNEPFWDYFTDVPIGWARRNKYEYFYAANSLNLSYFLIYRNKHPDFKFTMSFTMFLMDQLKLERASTKALELVGQLVLCEENKSMIKALPDFFPKEQEDYLHQKIAFRYGSYLPCAGLFMEQGTGKTKVALETFVLKSGKAELNLKAIDPDMLEFMDDVIDRLLVIGPLSVMGPMGAWAKYIKMYGLTSIRLRGSQEEKIKILEGAYGQFDVYMANYEGLIARDKSKQYNIEESILDWVDDRTMIILDETSKIKNFSAHRTKLVIGLGRKTKYKMILTGTPVTQGAFDLFSQMYFLDNGDTFGTSQDRFLQRYFDRAGWAWAPKGGKHGWALKEINELIYHKSIRFTKDEALDLPPKTFQNRVVEMTAIQTEYYNTVLAQEIIKLENMERVTAQNILVMIMRLQQITSGFLQPKTMLGINAEIKSINGPNPKMQELEEIFEELGDAAVVIWSRFRYDIDQITKLLTKNHISWVKYIGGMNDKDKEEAERMFVQGEAQVFVSVPQAGGFGMNLQRASYMIYYNNDYSLQNRLQSEDRAHRIGMGNKLVIIDIMAAHPGGTMTIDMAVKAVLKGKKDIADIVTGDYKKFFYCKDITDDDIVIDEAAAKTIEQRYQLEGPQ